MLGMRARRASAEALDAGEDLVGGFGPDEWFRIPVCLVNVGLDRSFQAVGADKDTALETAPGQKREPAFHPVEPGRAGWGEVQMPARSLHQPVMHEARLVA